jgi:hypothetical protein
MFGLDDPEAIDSERKAAEAALRKAVEAARKATVRANCYKTFGPAIAIAEAWNDVPPSPGTDDVTRDHWTVARALIKAVELLVANGISPA